MDFEQFRELLVEQYRRKHILRKEEQVIPFRADKLVKLQLVEGEKEEGYAANWQRGKTDSDQIRQGSRFDLRDRALGHVKRTPIEYSKIFKVEKEEVKRVLAEGEAGVGKSTFCTALSEQWANGELFFELVLHLPLRENVIASALSVYDLLKFFHTRVGQSVADYIEKKHGNNMLFILDGWDELSDENRQRDSFIYRLLVGDELLKASILLTSRPSASASLHRLHCIDQCIEIVGFDNEAIKDFIVSEFEKDPDKGHRLLNEVKHNALVDSLCTVPLNCAIICHLWRTSGKEQIPATMTGLYKDIVFNIVLHDIHRKFPEYKNSIPTLTSFDDLSKDFKLQRSWWNLCEFAFRAIEQDKLVFTQRELNNCDLGFIDYAGFGLLQAADTPTEVGLGNKSFHFLHLTFGEYLAALYLANQVFVESDGCLMEIYANSKNLLIVWRFFFGICGMHAPIINKYLTCQPKFIDLACKFLESLLTKVQLGALTLDYVCRLLFHCSFEANNHDFSSAIAELIWNYVNSRDSNIYNTCNAFDFAALMQVISHTKYDTVIDITFNFPALKDENITELICVLNKRKLKVRNFCITMSKKLTEMGINALFNRAASAFQRTVLSILIHETDIEDCSSIKSILPQSSASSLKCLYLCHSPLNSHTIHTLAETVSNGVLVNLYVFSLNKSLSSEPEVNIALINSLVHCPALEFLSLSENNLCREEIRVVARLSLHTHFTSLELNKTNLDDNGIAAFAQTITNVCHIVFLQLEENNIGLGGFVSLMQSISSGMLYVKHINLKKSLAAVRPMTVGKPYQVYKPVSFNLEELGVMTNCFQSIIHLSNDVEVLDIFLQQFNQHHSAVALVKELDTEINLSENSFHGANILSLGIIMYLFSPRYLLCRKCDITSDDLKNLVSALSKVQSQPVRGLSFWDLRGNDIDDSGINTLLELLPLFPDLHVEADSVAFDHYKNPAETETLQISKLEKHKQAVTEDPPQSLETLGIVPSLKSHSDRRNYLEDSAAVADIVEEEKSFDESKLNDFVFQDGDFLSVPQHTIMKVVQTESESSQMPMPIKLQPPPLKKKCANSIEFKSDFKACNLQTSDVPVSATDRWELNQVHQILTGNGVTIAILDTCICSKHKAFQDAVKVGRIFEHQLVSGYTLPGGHGSMAAFVAGGDGFEAEYFRNCAGEIPQNLEPIKLDKPMVISSGVAPGARLLIYQVGEPYLPANIVTALQEIVDRNNASLANKQPLAIDIVSMSFAMEYDQNNIDHKNISTLLTHLRLQGVICVAAAGNYGNYQSGVLFPANDGYVISVGALSKHGTVAASNPQGTRSADVYAPGKNIPFPFIHSYIHQGTTYYHNGVACSKGSSCATPAIAGLIALLLQFDQEKGILLRDDPKAVDVLGRDYRDLNYLKNVVLKDMEGNGHVFQPLKYFKESCKLPIQRTQS